MANATAADPQLLTPCVYGVCGFLGFMVIRCLLLGSGVSGGSGLWVSFFGVSVGCGVSVSSSVL